MHEEMGRGKTGMPGLEDSHLEKARGPQDRRGEEFNCVMLGRIGSRMRRGCQRMRWLDVTHPVHHFLGSPLCAGLCWQQTQRSRAKGHLSGHFWSDRTQPWREFCFRSSDHCLPWCTQHTGAGHLSRGCRVTRHRVTDM